VPSRFRFIASEDSLTGIVAAAALSASLALRVLKSVLEVRARKDDSPRLGELIALAGEAAGRLVELAAEDSAAYAAYIEARRERSPSVQAALRKAIEAPLDAARSAAAGIDLCLEAAGYARGAIAADIAGGAALLAGAVSAILCSVDANLRQVKEEGLARALAAERQTLEMHAIRQAEAVLTTVKTASNSDRPLPPA
jgi:formiminotetrahydrofolate cyclodeaminase